MYHPQVKFMAAKSLNKPKLFERSINLNAMTRAELHVGNLSEPGRDGWVPAGKQSSWALEPQKGKTSMAIPPHLMKHRKIPWDQDAA